MPRLTNSERWYNWMLLEHGSLVEYELEDLSDSYEVNSDAFVETKFYFDCGRDRKRTRYEGYDLCDFRSTPGVLLWDVLKGFPHPDGFLTDVRCNLGLGRFTYDQARFVMREVARTLVTGGRFKLTFRNLSYLTMEVTIADAETIIRRLYGGEQGFHNRTKSCWVPTFILQIAREYCMDEVVKERLDRGFNTTMVLERKKGKLKKFSPEPKLDEDFDNV